MENPLSDPSRGIPTLYPSHKPAKVFLSRSWVDPRNRVAVITVDEDNRPRGHTVSAIAS